MKSIIIVVLFILSSSQHLYAQEFSIKGIEKLPTDMDARVNFARKDQNGKTCAIIKITTPLTGFSFDTGTLSVQYVVEKTGEIWVYVQPGVKKITIAHQTLGVVREWDIPIKIEEACSYELSLDIQSSANSGIVVENPQRIVLYKLRRNEVLCGYEFLLAFKTDGYHFTCITKDTILTKEYLICDGIKKVIADKVNADYIDPSNYNNSIFQYKNGNEWTFFIEGKSYGPYETKWIDTNGSWESSNENWIRKEIFGIYNESKKKYDMYYRGHPYESKYKPYTWKTFTENYKTDTIVSINKKFKVFSNEFGTITYNGIKHRILSEQTFDKDWRQDISVLDDGRCIIGFHHKSHPYRWFIYEKRKSYELRNNQFFNFRTSKIDDSDTTYGIFFQSNYAWDKKGLRVLHDKSERHTLETCGLYNYVLVDNKEYGTESAIFILYDDNRNEFQWISLEDKDLVLYRFRL